MFKNPITVIALAMGFGLIATLVLLSQRHRSAQIEAPLPQPLGQTASDSKSKRPTGLKNEDGSSTEAGAVNGKLTQLVLTRARTVKAPLTTEEKRQLTLVMPPLSTVRNEVSGDPHNTPPTLIRFSSEMGEKMELAEQSEPTAHFFFTELKKCATTGGKHGLVSVQALCLADAQTLGGKFDSLGEETRKLFLKANPEAVKLSRLLQ